MVDENNNVQEEFLDAENWRNPKENAYGFKETTMAQFNKVVHHKSQEMREGKSVYTTDKTSGERQMTRYLPDTREVYINSLETLYDIIRPRMFFSKARQKHAFKQRAIFCDGKLEEIEALELSFESLEKKDQKEKEKQYWKQKLKIYQIMFREICLFLEDLGWFTVDDITDE